MSHRLLIVDDDNDIRALLAIILRSAGYAVYEAADGQQALVEFPRIQPDLVIVDITMPGMSGWEVCRRLKEDPATAHVPVLICTVRSQMHDMAQVINVPHDGFINKPFEKHNLLATVQGLLPVHEG